MAALTEEQTREMIEAARAARENAYAPYSRYRVGATVLTGRGEIVAGANVENASYGGTICAERVALCSAVANGAREIVACAVVTGGNEPAAPCGLCRQVLYEFGPDMTILMAAAEGEARDECALSELLPRGFRGTALTPS